MYNSGGVILLNQNSLGGMPTLGISRNRMKKYNQILKTQFNSHSNSISEEIIKDKSYELESSLTENGKTRYK
jgi:hypothetical protein